MTREDYINSLELDNAELKKENEELKKKLYLCTPEMPQNSHRDYISYVDLVNKNYSLEKETQQKEFIKYLEDEIKLGTFPKCVHNTVLQKYKEIIGDIEK